MKTVERIFWIVALIFVAYIIASFIDVNIHNIGSYDFANWNFFKIVFNP